jgi:hypothetical protein
MGLFLLVTKGIPMFNFTAPGGRAYLTIRSTNPDPARRFNVTVSDGFGIGSAGLRELAKGIDAFAKKLQAQEKAAAKAAAEAEAEATPEATASEGDAE